jgi:hypothetical protein
MDSSPYAAPAFGTWPALTNYGSVVGNGTYTPGTMPGIVPGPVSPNGVPFGGLSVASGTNVAQFSGVSSFADVGSSSVFNPTGQVPFAVTATFRGNPCDGRSQMIVGHGLSSWYIGMNNTGHLVSSFGTNSSSSAYATSANVYNDGNWHQVVAGYLPSSSPTTYGTNVLYVDGVLAGAGVAANSFGKGTNLDAMIGSNPQYTNNPAGVGQQFAGQVCEVAVFTNALTVAQIQTLYNTAGVAPYITTQPVSATANQGGVFTNTVVAGGSQPLAYQWYSSNGVARSGQTNASLILNPVQVTDASTNWYVIVTNSYGSVTSSVVSLTVSPHPTVVSEGTPIWSTSTNTIEIVFSEAVNPTIATTATNYSLNNGASVLSAAIGNAPNVVILTTTVLNPINGYTLTIKNVQDLYGNAIVTISLPNGVYPPLTALWVRADANASVTTDSGTNTVNEWNDQSGNGNNLLQPEGQPYEPLLVTNALNGLPVIVFTATNATYMYANSSPTLAITNDMSIFAVVNFNSLVGGTNGMIVSKTTANIADPYDYYVGATTGAVLYRGNGTTYAQFTASSVPSTGVPHLLDVVMQGTSVTHRLDGNTNGSGTLSTTIGDLGDPLMIGTREDGHNRLNGYMAELIIIGSAVSSNDVASLENYLGTKYNLPTGSQSPPVITQEPVASTNVNQNSTLVVSAAATGNPAVAYQWYATNNVAVAGQTNATLVISNIQTSDSYYLNVTNIFGSVNSTTVTITVFTNAQITSDLPPQVSVLSGNSYTYSIGVVGAPPFSYQWYNTTPVAGQTNSTYAVTAGNLGSTTYYVVITNIYGAVTSSVSTFTSIAQLTNSFATNVLGVLGSGHGPVGYWPMHEVEAPAQGDIETNYGTLGLLGTGYYPDWEGASAGFIRQEPGPLADGSDVAVCFNTLEAGSGTGDTNALYVPHTSPLSTLNPPFSVECWFLPSNNVAGDIWSQSGFEGLNAGASGNGNGNTAGIRLSWSASPAGLVVYTYDGAGPSGSGNQTLSPQTAVPFNQWCHVVVTCDASTNISLAVNGSVVSTRPGVGLYSPDYWTPFEVGDGRGNTRPLTGTVGEVAVYTNVITDIGAHYTAGTSVSPSPTYFQLVTNDNPVIYLRMNSFPYTAPAVGAWPELINYGSGAGNGVYSPGTMPGIVAGPANTNGVPFTGLSGTNVAQFSGVSSFADVGNSSVFNPTGQVPFAVTAMFRGNPCDGRTQTIVGHGASWSIYMNTSGQVVSSFGTNSSGSVTSANVYNDGNWHQVVAGYAPDKDFMAGAYGTNALFVDGVLAGGGVAANNFGLGTNLDVMIGADPQYINNPAGVGQQFAGQVCEVAIFNSALTPTQIQQIYNSALPPVTVTPTISVTGSGNNVTITYAVTLLSSTNVNGQYQPVPGAVSPYTTPATNAQQFYRSSSP